MSEQLPAAAAAVGAPADLVERSARARAAAQGTNYEDILAAWAGGDPAPPASAPTPDAEPAPVAPPESPTTTATPEPAPAAAAGTDTEAIPPSAPASAPAPAAAVAIAGPLVDAAPLLEGKREHLTGLMTGILGLLAAAILLVVVIPANGVGDDRHIVGDAALSALEDDGRQVYLQQGCQYCHTQNVRPVVADVGLGAVTETGARSLANPATFGFQRIGPDLARVAGRLPEDVDAAEYLTDFLSHPTEVVADSAQPPYGHLSNDDMAALVAYVLALR